MGLLIDLCGTPIQLEQVKQFRLIKREYLFYPSYREVKDQSFSLFGRAGTANKPKFEFVKMVPFGAVLNDKEKPYGSYEIKSFGEAASFNILTEMGKTLGNVANLAADLLKVDTSGNREFNILTQGRRLTTLKLRDIPAKVAFLNGKVNDVYKNDSVYQLLGESTYPAIVVVPTLVVTVDKSTHVFFGGGVDLEDAEGVYHSLLEAYNQFHLEAQKNKSPALPKISLNIPKLSIPSIKIQSPFVFKKKDSDSTEDAEELIED